MRTFKEGVLPSLRHRLVGPLPTTLDALIKYAVEEVQYVSKDESARVNQISAGQITEEMRKVRLISPPPYTDKLQSNNFAASYENNHYQGRNDSYWNRPRQNFPNNPQRNNFPNWNRSRNFANNNWRNRPYNNGNNNYGNMSTNRSDKFYQNRLQTRFINKNTLYCARCKRNGHVIVSVS